MHVYMYIYGYIIYDYEKVLTMLPALPESTP